MKKIIISLVFSLAILFASTFPAFANGSFAASNVTFNKVGSSATISFNYTGSDNFTNPTDIFINDNSQGTTYWLDNGNIACTTSSCTAHLVLQGGTDDSNLTSAIIIVSDSNFFQFNSQSFPYPLFSSPTPTPTPTPLSNISLNAGGTTASSFLSDRDYSGGQPFASTASVDTSGVTNPAPQSVYQSVRYGNFTYNISHLYPNSTYTVKLHFNELYWGTDLTGGNGGIGSRVFNTTINGTQVLTNFDIYADAGGANKAVVKQFTTTSDANGKISIVFTTVTDNAMVNGIEISQ